MIVCDSCGAEMKFDVLSQKLKCEYCGNMKEVENEKEENVIKADVKADFYEVKSYHCPQCGAQICTTDDTAVTFCSYCGSSVMIEERIEKQRKPDYVIPFSITREQCEAIYRKKINKSLFTSNKMKKGIDIEKFRGIYMPFWLYEYEYNGKKEFEVFEAYSSGNYRCVQYYNVKADINVEHKNIVYDASSKFYDDISHNISNYDISQAKNFDIRYLSGFYVDAGDVSPEVYKSNAENIVKEYINSEIKLKLKKSVNKDSIMVKVENIKLIYLPVWFLAIKNGKRMNYAAVNGSTGQLFAELPINAKNFFGFSIVSALAIFALLNSFLILTPTVVLVISFFLSLICIIILNSNYDAIYLKDLRIQDKGIGELPQDNEKKTLISRLRKALFDEEDIRKKILSDKEHELDKNSEFYVFLQLMFWLVVICLDIEIIDGINDAAYAILVFFSNIVIAYFVLELIKSIREVKAPIKIKFPKFLLPMIAILICFIVVIIKPVANEYYYLAVISSYTLIGISMNDVVKSYNYLISRKLPQFNKRGGDTDV